MSQSRLATIEVHIHQSPFETFICSLNSCYRRSVIFET